MSTMMINLFLACMSLTVVAAAPAVSSVHVSFVSGNKATQYSHGIGASSTVPLIQYDVAANPTHHNGMSRDHNIRARSVTNRPQRRRQTLAPVTLTTSYFDETDTTTPTFEKLKTNSRIPIRSKMGRNSYKTSPTDATTIPTTFEPTTSAQEEFTTEPLTTLASSASNSRKLRRSRVRFVQSPTASASEMPSKTTVTMSGGDLLSELKQTTSDALKAINKKPKDSKAVKRSPFVGENFEAGGITFPDFDDFGGNEFGSLRNFAGAASGGGGGGGGHRGSLGAHNQPNPEALSPDGVFLPPLPTEASDYENNDPYLADPDTAKYAAQHPPFFAAFPHKRSVLALNEQRVHNGLEPNILRSIRPYFPFFESANNHISHSPISYDERSLSASPEIEIHDGLPHHPQQTLPGFRFPHRPTHFFEELDPNVLLHSETALLKPISSISTSWAVLGTSK